MLRRLAAVAACALALAACSSIDSPEGLTPDVAARADERIRRMVDSAVNQALAADDGACADEEAKCGIFELTLAVLPCSHEMLCLKQDVNGVPVGSATSGSMSSSSTG